MSCTPRRAARLLRLPGAALALWLAACPSPGIDVYDTDGDGTADSSDCGPTDPAVHPDAADDVGNGVDDNCDGVDGVDADGDGHASEATGGDDCNDGEPAEFPGAPEVEENGIDEDCDGADLVCDFDGDGLRAATCGGLDCDDGAAACGLDCSDDDADGFAVCSGDCDDGNAGRSPEADEACDGVDTDCDGTLLAGEEDSDGDGARTCDPDPDCDDADPLRFPGNPELCDGLDGDCDPATWAGGDEGDGDGDGDLACSDCDDADPGRTRLNLDGDPVSSCDGDCDDLEPLAYPGAPDGAADELDNNCDGVPGVDGDGDGHAGTATGGADCDDGAPGIHPGAAELCDAEDQDCDGLVDEDFDLDGDGVTTCLGDCDDANASVLPGAVELCDGLDGDCDGAVPADEVDGDGDGVPLCLDCVDGDPSVHPAAAEVCDGADQDCDGDADEGFDVDGDGVTSCGGDCDDGNPAVVPGAAEVCDGLDTDCDVATTVLGGELDADGDGWIVCAGYVDHDGLDPAGQPIAGGEDCDDDEPVVHPGAVEDCDGLDGDCDPGVSAAPAEVDVDGDQHLPCGPFVSRGAFNAAGLLLVGGDDCDDLEPARHPAHAEVCDGLDNDCDGATTAVGGEDDGDLDRYLPCAAFVDVGALNAASAVLLGGGDCDDAAPLTWPGNPEICDGVADDCDPATVPDAPEDDADGDQYVACSGFVDVGAVNASGEPLLGGLDCDDADPAQWPGRWEPTAYPDESAPVDLSCDGVDGTSLLWAQVGLVGPLGDSAATSVAGGGDVDGDGLDDLLIGARLADHPPVGTGGAVFVVLGASLEPGEDLELEDAHAILYGESPGDQAGMAVAWAGDVDGDGLDDVLVGAPSHDGPWTGSGRVYLLLGASLLAGGVMQLADADFIFSQVPQSNDWYLGNEFSSAGDVDGDGLDDVLLGGTGWSTGGAYVFLGADLDTPGEVLTSEAHARLMDDTGGTYAGSAVAGLGDVDGDGLDDVAIGAYGHAGSGSQSGRAWIFLGPSLAAGGLLPVESADIALISEGAGNAVGSALAPAGDVDGDGLADLLVGGHFNDDIMQGNGKVYVVLGADLPQSGSFPMAFSHAAIFGNFVNAYLGEELGAAGDVDGDGLADVVVGSYRDDEGAKDAGKAWLFYGSSLASGGVYSVEEADAAFVGEGVEDRSGAGGTSLGDVDGDGLDDLLIGAPQNTDGGAAAGKAYVLLSPF
jgi:hypothetical protein